MDDSPRAVAAFAGQVPALAVVVDVERHAELCEPADRGRGALDDELDDAAIVEAGAGDHRVLDMRLEAVARLQHRGDAALRPAGRALALQQHRDLEPLGEVERRGQPGGAGADDHHIVGVVISHPSRQSG